MTKRQSTAHRIMALIADHLYTSGLALALIAAGFVVAYQFVEPAPPDSITIASGGPKGAYFRYAGAYREILARQGVTLKVLETAGSVDNVSRLVDPDQSVDLAFVQGGITAPDAELVSLGSVYYEPLWVFHRAGVRFKRLSQLQGRRIAVGGEGSGTRALAREVLTLNGIDETKATLLPLSGQDAANALIAGEVDVMLAVISPDSEVVQRLIRAKGIRLLSFRRAEAHARIYSYLSVVSLPEGVLDIASNIPPSDRTLLATTANLVARSDLHPALVGLLLQAASEVHSDGGVFERPNAFPSPRFVSFPLSDEAKRYYESGPPFLQRFLPFWAANLVDRLKIMIVPLVGLLIPLVKIMPPMYRWRIRSKIYRWYAWLRDHDPEFQDIDKAEVAQHRAALDTIEAEVTRVSVPNSYADEVYHLRLHIEMVRRKLDALDSNPVSSPAGGGAES
jgi:uncharacterized protein